MRSLVSQSARDVDPYAPLDTLKSVASDVWIVDGPLISFGPSLFAMPFSTRMTIVRLRDGGLFVHSPTPLGPRLHHDIGRIGEPAFIIGPNRLHYWWIPQWNAAYPTARVFLAPEIKLQAEGKKDICGAPLSAQGPLPWSEDLDTLAVKSAFMTEFVFFHRASRTLILTDLIENFEPDHVHSGWLRLLMRLGGVLDPHGGTPRDLRYTFRRYRDDLRRAIETMIGWNPERIILAHGRCYMADGAGELRRAFDWLLRD